MVEFGACVEGSYGLSFRLETGAFSVIPTRGESPGLSPGQGVPIRLVSRWKPWSLTGFLNRQQGRSRAGRPQDQQPIDTRNQRATHHRHLPPFTDRPGGFGTRIGKCHGFFRRFGVGLGKSLFGGSGRDLLEASRPDRVAATVEELAELISDHPSVQPGSVSAVAFSRR